MNPDFQRLMQDATRLTRAGDLQAATAAIQSALRGTPVAASMPGELPVIDVEAREIDDGARDADERAPTGGDFVAGRTGRGTLARDYKLYIPPQGGEQPLPLVLMLHGCTQDPDDFAAGTRMNALAREQGCYVLYPAQSRQANPQGCWNWFKHSHQERGRGEPALLAGLVAEVTGRHRVDPARVYVAGLSAGGAMAAILGEAYPEVFAAVGVHSGLAAGAARDLPSALAAMKSGGSRGASGAGRPTIVFHGDADATVHPVNGAQVAAASVGAGPAAEVDQQRAAGGRGYTKRTYRGADGSIAAEHWVVHGSPHAWSGGSAQGSYTDPRGPDASAEMLRFFMEHPRA